MRRSICYCEPTYVLAGEVNTWKFLYTTATKLPKGTKLKFDLMSSGRPIDWETPESSLRCASNVIYAKIEDGKPIAAKEVEVPDRFIPQYEFTLPEAVEAGGVVSIIIGSPKASEKTFEKNGNQAQLCSQRRRPFLLYIDTSGKGRYGEPEVFHLDVKGNELKNIRILSPSHVVKNKRFDINVRFEDEFGNLTSNAPEETMIELTYENIRENLNWKLFIPETGFLTLPNLYFNEAGVYTICLTNTHTGEKYYSSPVKCFPDVTTNLYWGLLHGESERYDSTENIESCMRHFRDERGINFYGLSPFESQEETSNDIWKSAVQNAIEFDESDRFVTFIGCQWAGKAGDEGVRHLLYTKESKQILRKKEAKNSSLSKIYKSSSPKDLISVPTFTMGKGYHYNFKNFDPEFERVVEIYNAWGSSECTSKNGNPTPISGGKKAVPETAEGSIQEALARNLRFGFVAGGLDDRGIYGDFFDSDQEQYHPGITAILAKELSRASLAEALQNRSCYATTGERIIIGFFLAGEPMGSELSTVEKHGLLYNRHISGYVAGTCPITKVELVRNGDVIATFNSDVYHLEFTYDDSDSFEKIAIDAKDKKPPFIYYYLRVILENGHMGWSSPIWVDYVPGKPVSKNTGKKVAKPAPKPAPEPEIDFNELDDDEDEEDLD